MAKHLFPRRALIRLGAVMLATAVAGCQPARRGLEGVGLLRPPEPRFYALLLNGGGKPETNYQSHLTHVRDIVALLREGGLPDERIFIFASDGSAPEADLATRERNEQEWFWILPQASVGRQLRPPITLEDSVVDGFELRPATRNALTEWFKKEGRKLGPHDTLLLYVTDHGRKNAKDLKNNTITLWNESLNVAELKDMLARLDPKVRVVMLMSQCFSGSFANVILPDRDDALPSGRVCGYFASTADRPAYGCYPENRGKDGVGHSHHFIDAAGVLGNLSEAHRRVLVTDDTPDVPHTASDFFLDDVLQRAATSSGLPVEEIADEMITKAWEDKSRWEPEIRLLDRVGQAFGIFSPRSLAELDRQAKVMPEVSQRLGTYESRWREAFESLAVENLRRFIDAHPEWKERLEPETLHALAPAERGETTAELLAALVPFTQANRKRMQRLELLRERMQDAGAARYRMEVRLGVVLRMRAILTSIAGRIYIENHGTPAEQETLARLEDCESLEVLSTATGLTAAALDPPPSFPPLSDDQQVVDAVMPAWMGIRYRPLSEDELEREKVEVGAVRVVTVFPDSPATGAGLEVGDVILGPPGARFEEPNAVREWTMRREVGEPAPLEIRRERRLKRVTLRPGPFPLEMPELPGPPKVGSAAPPIDVEVFRGPKKLAGNGPRLLFFWATWCGPCKASLPELLAFAESKGVEVVAITDEPAPKLEEFLGKLGEPFPEIVASDRYRSTFQNYGVSGTPTFVLVDAAGIVRHYKTGYNAKLGLGIGDWKWEKKAVSRRGE
jgi:thiol-disulfide isomerase/thioredoxin